MRIKNNVKNTLLNKINFRNEMLIEMNYYVVISQFTFLTILLRKKIYMCYNDFNVKYFSRKRIKKKLLNKYNKRYNKLYSHLS